VHGITANFYTLFGDIMVVSGQISHLDKNAKRQNATRNPQTCRRTKRLKYTEDSHTHYKMLVLKVLKVMAL